MGNVTTRHLLRSGAVRAVASVLGASALGALASLSPVDGMVLVMWCLPLGLALGLIVGPRSGRYLRVFVLVVGAIAADQVRREVVDLVGPERPYVLAMSFTVLVASAVFGFRSIKANPLLPALRE